MATPSKKVPIVALSSSDNAMRSCNVCKTPPMGRNEHIMHILGKKHVKNIKSKTLAMMLNDEAERSLHVSQYSANTTAEAIVNYFWKFGVRHVHYTKSYTFVEFESAKAAKDAMKGKHQLKGKNIVVAPKRRLSSAGDKNDEFKGLPLSTRMTDRLRRLNNPRDIEYLIPDLVNEIEVNDYRSRESIRGRMEMVLRQHFPAVRAFVFGSSSNNLGFRGCDIDLFVELGYDPWSSGIKSVCEKNAADTTWYIARLIKKERIGYQVQAVPRARVPIVKFREWHSGIFVDVSFKNGMPVHNTQLICQYTKTHELVRPYLMVIRYWAKIQGIAGGGQPASLITNYGFTMMMLWYLMYRSPPIIPTVANLKNSSGNNYNQNLVVDGWNCSFDKNVSFWRERRHNVAIMELVQEFFRFFGEVNLDKYVISPLSGTMVDRKAVKEKNFKELPGSFSTYLVQKNELQIDTPICVQDPFDHSHNVTRGLREGPLKVFQYKCRRADKFCEDVLRGSLPMDTLLTKINITPETMVEIFPEDEEEEEKSADPDDSVEILDDSSTNLDTSANSSIAEVITLNDTIDSDSMEEEVSVLNNEGRLVNKGKDKLLPAGSKSKSPPIITLELPPEEEALKFPLAFENVPQFSIHFDGTIDAQITETASSEKEVATAASNLVHFVLQESLLCKVEVIEAPLNKSDKGRKRAASDSETDEPSKRIKGDHGASAGVANKYRRIAKYRCKMEHAFWVGRKKISKQVPPNVDETPLQHEKAITNVQQSSVCEDGSNGVILQCMVSLWQEMESPFNILVTAVSTSSAKDTKAHMIPMFSYFSSLAPSLLKKVTHYLEINHSKR